MNNFVNTTTYINSITFNSHDVYIWSRTRSELYNFIINSMSSRMRDKLIHLLILDDFQQSLVDNIYSSLDI